MGSALAYGPDYWEDPVGGGGVTAGEAVETALYLLECAAPVR
ncbi:hypothetical protein ONR57_18695 [Hoyosella sp. YIM 151337]|nr:hypothetical protein [Hoyosella sp. YIM 151337]MCW4355335.1 hypothetical protein [Hoyosella sp. YIM 151337]